MKVESISLSGARAVPVLVPNGYNWMTIQVAYGEACIVDADEVRSKNTDRAENWFVITGGQEPLDFNVSEESVVCLEHHGSGASSFVNIVWSK